MRIGITSLYLEMLVTDSFKNLRSSLVVQQFKDPVLSLKQPMLLLWIGFDPWPKFFHMPQVRPKRNSVDIHSMNVSFSACKSTYI